jgi:hypothetical protein
MFGLSRTRIIIYACTLVAFAGILTFAGCEHSNANTLRAENQTLEDSVTSLKSANDSNQVVIDSQKVSIEAWKKLATTSASMKAAAARAADLEKENTRLNAELDKRAEKDYAKPDCVNLLEMDFEAVCPGIAAGLRARASRYEDGFRGNPGSGGGEDRP